MKKFKRILSIAIAALMVAAVLVCLTGCSKNTGGKDTPETNPLYAYEEIVELNKYSAIPYIFGTKKSELGSDYENFGGTKDHFENYLSKDNIDVSYSLSTYDYYYGENNSSEELYITSVRIRPESKTIEKTSDGGTRPVYVTSRSILGVQVGDSAEDAGEILENYGYTKIYEEKPTSNLPQSCEHAYQKGIIVISLAVENKGEVSSIYAWIPYNTQDIDEVFTDCKLPANLGIIYNVYANENFTYSEKTETDRVYTSTDGSIAVMRGFPDITDMMMVSEISFKSSEYNVSGASCGMTMSEAKSKLTEAGWTADANGFTFKKGMVFVNLYDTDNINFDDDPIPSNTDNAIIRMIRVELAKPTNLERINVER